MDSVRRLKAAMFHALGNPTRLAILEILRDGELPVAAIMTRLGLDQANISQHLATLRSRRLVTNRKEGNQVFYSIRDPLLLGVIDLMKKYCMAHLEDDLVLLREMKAEGKRK
jgi:DNA-binding transcriptional ArsR family regulator